MISTSAPPNHATLDKKYPFLFDNTDRKSTSLMAVTVDHSSHSKVYQSLSSLKVSFVSDMQPISSCLIWSPDIRGCLFQGSGVVPSEMNYLNVHNSKKGIGMPISTSFSDQALNVLQTMHARWRLCDVLSIMPSCMCSYADTCAETD